MNKLRYDELKEGEVYFSVRCGTITIVELQKILDDRRFKLHEVGASPLYPYEPPFACMSDYGIVDCPGNYGNQFNAMFKNRKDAEAFVSTPGYRNKVAEFNNSWGGWEEEFDNYCFNEGK